MMAAMGPMGKGMADVAAKMKDMRGFPSPSPRARTSWAAR